MSMNVNDRDATGSDFEVGAGTGRVPVKMFRRGGFWGGDGVPAPTKTRHKPVRNGVGSGIFTKKFNSILAKFLRKKKWRNKN